MRKPAIQFLINGDGESAMAIRALAFAPRMGDEFDIYIAYRSANKIFAILQFLRQMLRVRPSVVYVFDLAFSGVVAAACYRLVARSRVVVDTGDAIYELSRSTGNRGPLGLALTRLLEWIGFSISDRIVVRSHPHQELLAGHGIIADVIPDGVDTEQFSPSDQSDLRREYGLEGFTVVGLLGSLIWSSRWQMCYGWELIEAVHQLRHRPVKGFIIGDGSGLAQLKLQCVERGIEDRIVFAGRIPFDDLPRFINMMDICLSTQTNDIPGQVRTTGKLPIYLACGRFVLASQVGEAARVLPPEMLVPYEGTKDEGYPRRLAERIESLLNRPERLQHGALTVDIARKQFDYSVLTLKVRQLIRDLLSGDGSPEEEAVITN